MQERRSEPRFLCADLVKVRGGSASEAVANLEDISPSGACLQMETALAVGTEIEIHCASCRLRGRVRYCRFCEIGYFLGVQFEPGASWDRTAYCPSHLLEIPVKDARGAA